MNETTFKDGCSRPQRKHYEIPESAVHVDFQPTDTDVMNKVKAKAIQKAMYYTNNDRSAAGRILGMCPKSIRYFLDKLTKGKSDEDLSN